MKVLLTILKVIGGLLVLPVMLIAAAAIVIVILLAWLFGIKVKVTKGDVTIGYVRWFTWYPVEKN